MLAVFAPLEDVRAVLQEHALDLVIANKNAPRQCVLSGPAAEIERSRAVFARPEDRDPPDRRSRAFHSRLVAGAERSFRSVLESIDFHALGDSGLRQYDGRFPTPPIPVRPARSWPVSSPGRSNSSPRSKRCTGWGRGRFSKSAPTRSSPHWFARSSRDGTTARWPSTPRVERPATCMISPARSHPWPHRGMRSISLAGTSEHQAAAHETAGADREGLRRQCPAQGGRKR